MCYFIHYFWLKEQFRYKDARINFLFENQGEFRRFHNDLGKRSITRYYERAFA